MQEPNAQEREEGLSEPSSPSRVELLRQWVAGHRRPAGAYAGVILFVLVAAGYFTFSAASEQGHQRTVDDQIKRLSSIAATSPQRLQEVTKQFNHIQDSLPASNLKETDVFRTLLALSESISRDIDVKIDYHAESQTTVGSTTYRAMAFSMTFSGPSDPVEELLAELNRPPPGLATLVMDKLIVSSGDISKVSADFVVYTQSPKG